jgi:alanyl-tRNA synthetase
LPEDLYGEWEAVVDKDRRAEIQKHHSATHLMHAALRRHLGDHVVQKGSLVEADRLRFDFSHYEGVEADVLDSIEAEINARIQENIPIESIHQVPIDEARQMGAMMLFGEKYGDKVRVVSFDRNYSIELCGGTHVNATGEIGYFRFLSESSAASGVRRVEAVVGKAADAVLRDEKRRMGRLIQMSGSSKDPVATLDTLLNEKKALEKELEKFKAQQAFGQLREVLQSARVIADGVSLVTGTIDGADMNTLKQLGYDILRERSMGTVSVLGSADVMAGKVSLVATVTDDLVKSKGLKAGSLVGEVAKLTGGGGGGQPTLATAGGKQPEKLDQAIDAVESILKSMI